MARTPRALTNYRKKRNFKVTSEPAPRPVSRAPGPPRFMVHKHDASRLHYDLRLEMEGVLASWALPKGPSYDPAVKRLAVQTEDHPLEYGDFEGRIPDGEYGAGDSLIWDRGVYQTLPPGQAATQRKKGHLHIVLQGQKLQGSWHLVRTRPQGGKAQWLCFKGKDGTEDASYDVVAEHPQSVLSGRTVTRGPLRQKTLRAVHPGPEVLLKRTWPPMLATLVKDASLLGPGGWSFEVKYDGYRGLAAISGGKLLLVTRNFLELSSRFPALARALQTLNVAEAVVDGEAVALDADGVSSFAGLGSPGLRERFVAFDLLWLDGADLRGRPLFERRQLLESVFANARVPLMVSETLGGGAAEALEEVRARGLEGLIAKRVDSPYVGARSKDWLKLKVSATQEVAILGFTRSSTGARAVGALLLGVFERGAFRFAGKVGTGFTDKVRRALWERLSQERVDRPAAKDAPRLRSATWVEPKLVAQVAFTEWTADGKLRHPSFQGLRMDKRPEECRRERPRAKTAKPRLAARRGRKR